MKLAQTVRGELTEKVVILENTISESEAESVKKNEKVITSQSALMKLMCIIQCFVDRKIYSSYQRLGRKFGNF